MHVDLSHCLQGLVCSQSASVFHYHQSVLLDDAVFVLAFSTFAAGDTNNAKSVTREEPGFAWMLVLHQVF